MRVSNLVCCGILAVTLTVAYAPALGQSAQSEPARGVFVTQIGDSSRATITQQNADSLARVVQNGNENQLELAQDGSASHRAQIAQDGDRNVVSARQDGEGTTGLAMLQEGNSNQALIFQRETAAAGITSAQVIQSGNGNSVSLVQDGSDNAAILSQVGDANTMSAAQLGSNNSLQWNQNGDGLADLRITQQGGGNMQVTQSNTGGAQFLPPPGTRG